MIRTRPLVGALLMAVVLILLPPVTSPASAASTYLCTGYVGCKDAGYSNFGYRAASTKMYWRMYSGHNCTNYVAYRLISGGMSAERPWSGTGMAYNWGPANRSITNQTPMVGAVAWWKKNAPGAGSSGHVAFVQRVLSATKIVISEDSWSGDFHWRTLTKAGGSWPSGFIHFDDSTVELKTAPVISGTPVVGSTLTASTGTWTPAGRYTFQWYLDGKAVVGATAATLRLTKNYFGMPVAVRVSAARKGYVGGSSLSASTANVKLGTFASTAAPTITGTPRVDEVLTFAAGAWSPTPQSTTIRWYADGKPISGATGPTLHLGQELIRQQITVRTVAIREGYKNAAVITAPTTPVAAGTIDVTQPFTLTGVPRMGRRLTVTPGTFDPADADVTYTWLRNGKPVAGVTGRTYDLAVADVGRQISVQVNLRHTGYRNRTLTLDADGVVTTVPSLRVVATGRPARAVVAVRVTAPGVTSPAGHATVKIGRHEVAGRVVDGFLRVVVDELPVGTHNVRVTYDGTSAILPGRATTTVKIPRG